MPPPTFALHELYKRHDVAVAMGLEHARGLQWRSGVVPVNDKLLLFVTLNKKGYEGEHRYEDKFEARDLLRWQSQARAAPSNAWGRKHISGDVENHLFVRATSSDLFLYLGVGRYIRHKREKPMTVWWQVDKPLPQGVYERFIAATDHAGGRVDPADPAPPPVATGPQLRAPPAPKAPVPDVDEPGAWGWAGFVEDFLGSGAKAVLAALREHHERRFADLPVGESQIRAWRKAIKVLQATLEPLRGHGAAMRSLLVLEYELPGEAGRRPDVVLVTPSQHVLVIECKGRDRASAADVDQAQRYATDLSAYHSECHERPVVPVLTLLREGDGSTARKARSGVEVLSVGEGQLVGLPELLKEALAAGPHEYDPQQWLRGEYAPLPHLVQAVIATFHGKELPRLKTVGSAHVGDAVQEVLQAVQQAEARKEHHLILVTGAPGSGKTLVGVESVIEASKQDARSLFLSGNGPLVAVLQDAFDRAGAKGAARSMIRGMHQFKQEVTRTPQRAPANVYVFDEGQRAWKEARGYAGSEIELLVDVASRNDWGVVVGLLGEGQEIYKKEDGAIETWLSDFAKAPKHGRRWTVHLPPGSQEVEAGEVLRAPHLHLHRNLRAKAATRLHEWVEAVLAGSEDAACEVMADLEEARYPIYTTTSRAAAEDYVRSLYEDTPDPRYGWLISSEHKPGRGGGMKAPFVRTQDNKRVWGPWFNAPPSDPESCCALTLPCPEFACQGLELDFALAHWGNDLVRDQDNWLIPQGVRSWGSDAHTLNAYRVLLTRGREGMVLLVEDPETRDYLERCGTVLLEAD